MVKLKQHSLSDVVDEQRGIDDRGHNVATYEDQEYDDAVHKVLWQDQRIERVALFNRVLVVILELVECDHLYKETRRVFSVWERASRFGDDKLWTLTCQMAKKMRKAVKRRAIM